MALSFTLEEIESVLEIVCNDIWSSFDGSVHLREMHRKMHASTLISIEGITIIAHSKSGSIAGSPLGDLVFTMAMSKVLRKLRESFAAHGVEFMVPTSPASEACGIDFQTTQCNLTDVSFVDDVACPIVATAGDMMRILPEALRDIDHSFALHAMTSNYSKGKSEVLMCYAGDGANKLRQSITNERNNVIRFAGACGKHKSINVVNTFKHVGIQANVSDSMVPEIVARIGEMCSIFRSMRRAFISNPTIELQKKLQVVQSVMLAKGLFNAGAWPVLYHSEYRKVHVAVMEIYRSIGQDPYNPDWEPDGSMMSRMELTSPRNLLRILRAGLLISLLRNKPFIVWVTICAVGDARRSWLRAVRDDLSWYDGKHEFFDGFGTISLRDAFAKVIKHSKQFKRYVLLICSQPANNIAEAWAKCKADVSLCLHHRCEMCAMNFQSTQELAVHNFWVHHVCRQM